MILGNLYHEIMNHHESRLRRNVSKANRRFVHKKGFGARRIQAKFCMRQKSSSNTYYTFAWQSFNEMMTQAQPSIKMSVCIRDVGGGGGKWGRGLRPKLLHINNGLSLAFIHHKDTIIYLIGNAMGTTQDWNRYHSWLPIQGVWNKSGKDGTYDVQKTVPCLPPFWEAFTARHSMDGICL